MEGTPSAPLLAAAIGEEPPLLPSNCSAISDASSESEGAMDWVHPGQSNHGENVTSRNVYFASLPRDFGDDELYNLTKPFGAIVSARAVPSRKSGRCKGYGFVLFENVFCATRCIEQLHGARVGGHKIQVRHARDEACNEEKIKARPGISEAAGNGISNGNGAVGGAANGGGSHERRARTTPTAPVGARQSMPPPPPYFAQTGHQLSALANQQQPLQQPAAPQPLPSPFSQTAQLMPNTPQPTQLATQPNVGYTVPSSAPSLQQPMVVQHSPPPAPMQATSAPHQIVSPAQGGQQYFVVMNHMQQHQQQPLLYPQQQTSQPPLQVVYPPQQPQQVQQQQPFGAPQHIFGNPPPPPQ